MEQPSIGSAQLAMLEPTELFRVRNDGGKALLMAVAALVPRAVVVAEDRKRVFVVDMDAAGNEEEPVASFEVDKQVEKVAVSECGAYIAVALASGALSLHKSSGQKLFSFLVVENESDDRVASIGFASSSEQSSLYQDIVVATESGKVTRFGDLPISDIEVALADGNTGDDVLESIGQHTQIQHFGVGRLAGDDSSIILAHRFENELVVIVANHSESLSAWKIGLEDDQSFERISSTSDGFFSFIESIQLSYDKQSIAVLASGHLSWWNWSDMTRIVGLDIDDIYSFAIGTNHSSSESALPMLVVARNSSNANANYSFEVVASTPYNPTQAINIVQAGSFSCSAAIELLQQTQDLILLSFSTKSSHIFAAHRCKQELVLMQWTRAEEAITITNSEVTKADAVNCDLTTDFMEVAKALESTTMDSFANEELAAEFVQRLKFCIDKVGESSDFTSEAIRILTLVSTRIRRHAWSPEQKRRPIYLELHQCSQDSNSILDRWTTFQLLSNTAGCYTSRQVEWKKFRSASIVDVLRYTLQSGRIRAATMIWSRHVSEEVIVSIRSLLDMIPCSLPVEVYLSWLRDDIIPALTQYADGSGTRPGANVSKSGVLLSDFASWVLERATEAGMRGDFQMGIRLCCLICRGSEYQDGDLSRAAYFKFRLKAEGSVTSPPHVDKAQDYVDEIEVLYQKLEHIKYLEECHDFKISLSLLGDETPATIAMGMLDRAQTVDAVLNDIDCHVRPYLAFCSVPVDPALCEYVVELAESLEGSGQDDAKRPMSVVSAISDVDIRVEATLALLRSLSPPYSPSVKHFAFNEALSWNSQRQEELCGHIRMMKIQEMLLTYGATRFNVADSRTASRLLSHILAQSERPSAIQDAMLLVDAYSQLHCDRAVVQYSENLFSSRITASTVSEVTAEAQARVGKMILALDEAKKRYSGAYIVTIATVMDEVVTFGTSLLENEERERELKQPLMTYDELAEMATPTTQLPSGTLAMLEALVAAYLPEISSLRDIALSAHNEGTIAFLDSSEFLPTTALLSDLRKLQRLESDHGTLLSIQSIRDAAQCENKLTERFRPEIMYTVLASSGAQETMRSSKIRLGKRKKHPISLEHRIKRTRHQDNVERISVSQNESHAPSSDTNQQRGSDAQADLLFKLSRFAATMGISSSSFKLLLAQHAAKHGDISQAARYARDMFAGKRFDLPCSGHEVPNSLGDNLKKIAIAISSYTATHVDDVYGGNSFVSSKTILSRMHAPTVSLELLQYTVCVCGIESVDETLVLLKGADLVLNVFQLTQAATQIVISSIDSNRTPIWQIYSRWFHGDASILPSDEAIRLATSLTYEEHANLTASVCHTKSIASKRILSFLVDHRADHLSLQVILSLRELPEIASEFIESQTGKVLSTVMQSRVIDNRFALGLMLTLDQKAAFKAFREQISRENVSKDFNRFQQLALIGADTARVWRQIAFLHQCVELEGNARWMHYLNLLGIKCDHKRFQSDNRDLDYIRSLVPELITRSSYDIYTVLEFTQHYQIDDSYPSLLYIEALLLDKEMSQDGNIDYQDRIVGVLQDVHKDHLVTLLLKTLPKISGIDYERLQFVFRVLLDYTSHKQKHEVERRIEVLHVLKNQKIVFHNREDSQFASDELLVNFHELIDTPRDILAAVLSEHNYNTLASIAIPLCLEPDELEILLLKNMVQHRLRSPSGAITHNTVAPDSAVQFSAFKSILERLVNLESRITAAEWLAEHFPLGTEKVKALEFALQAAKTDAAAHRMENHHVKQTRGKSTFTGTEALRRLEKKTLRAEIELMLKQELAKDPRLLKFFSGNEAVSSFLKLLKRPRDLFLEIYRRFALPCFRLSTQSLHDVADKVAVIVGESAPKLRLQLIREWLVLEAIHNPKLQEGRTSDTKNQEDPFEALEDEKLEVADEHHVQRILYVAMRCVRDDVPGADDVLKFLVSFANETKPRAGVTFRAKVRALRVAFRLGQMSNLTVVSRYMAAAFGADRTYAGLQDLVRYTTHCAHMVVFEERRVPIELNYFIGCDKEALIHSLLRQFPSRDPWLLRCISRLMLDFDVQSATLWDTVLSGMRQHGMFRSLSVALDGISQLPFVKSLENNAEVWELVLTQPLVSLLRRLQNQQEFANGSDPSSKQETTFAGLPVEDICSVLSGMVALLKKCPFLDRIDVSSFVIHLRDLSALADEQSNTSARPCPVDLYGVAVQCALIIPSPEVRIEALHRIIQAGAYLAVLRELHDVAYILNRDHLLLGEGNERSDIDANFSEELQLVQAAFVEARHRHGNGAVREFLDTPFERGYVEFEAANTESIDVLVANLLSEKRVEVAKSAVELWYYLHPAVVQPAVIEDDTSSPLPSRFEDGQWSVLKAFIAASKSPELDPFRLSGGGGR